MRARLCKVGKDNGAGQAVERGRAIDVEGEQGAESLASDCVRLALEVGATLGGWAVDRPTLGGADVARHKGLVLVRCTGRDTSVLSLLEASWGRGGK